MIWQILLGIGQMIAGLATAVLGFMRVSTNWL